MRALARDSTGDARATSHVGGWPEQTLSLSSMSMMHPLAHERDDFPQALDRHRDAL
jgi:hypothetical protein